MKYKLIPCFLFVLVAQFLFAQADESLFVTERCSAILKVAPEELSLRQFNGGVNNHVYLVSSTSGEKLVAKIFTQRSFENVHRIEQTVASLRQMGFPAPEMVELSLWEKQFPLHISRFAEGRHVTDEDLPEVARLMADLHIKGASVNPTPPEKYKGREHYKALFEKCKSWSSTERLKEIYEGLDLSYLAEIPKGTIHGDFSYTNLIKNEGLTLLDFDHMSTSYLLTDLARCHMFYGFDENGALLEEKVTNFAAAYDTVRPLTRAEKDYFYTHMTMLMIDTAIEMYYCMHIACDLSHEVVSRVENRTLTPELLVKKIESVQSKKGLSLP